MKNRIPFPKIKIPAGLCRNDGTPIPMPCFDEMAMEVEAEDSPEVVQMLTRLAEMISMLAQEMAASQASAAEAGEAAEMAQGEAAAAQQAAATAETDKTAAMEAADALRAEVEKLTAEVAPLRVKALEALKSVAGKVAAGVCLDAVDDEASIRRAAVAAKLGAEYGDAEKTSDAVIDGAWRVLVRGIDAAPVDAAAPSPGFMRPDNKPAAAPQGRGAALLNKLAE